MNGVVVTCKIRPRYGYALGFKPIAKIGDIAYCVEIAIAYADRWLRSAASFYGKDFIPMQPKQRCHLTRGIQFQGSGVCGMIIDGHDNSLVEKEEA